MKDLFANGLIAMALQFPSSSSSYKIMSFSHPISSTVPIPFYRLASCRKTQ